MPGAELPCHRSRWCHGATQRPVLSVFNHRRFQVRQQRTPRREVARSSIGKQRETPASRGVRGGSARRATMRVVASQPQVGVCRAVPRDIGERAVDDGTIAVRVVFQGAGQIGAEPQCLVTFAYMRQDHMFVHTAQLAEQRCVIRIGLVAIEGAIDHEHVADFVSSADEDILRANIHMMTFSVAAPALVCHTSL